MRKSFGIIAVLVSLLCLPSCNKNGGNAESDMGYISLDVTSVGTTYDIITRAIPDNYDARKLYVEILDSNGNIVESTENATDWSGKTFQMIAGKYTVNAHSAGWDGSDSGRDVPYYAGSMQFTVKAGELSNPELVCTLANVKVSVEFDKSVESAFKSAVVEVNSEIGGINAQTFNMGIEERMRPAYFPVGNLSAKLYVINNRNEQYSMVTPINDVKARDHYKLKYSTKLTGNGEFVITADDGTTQYTYTFSAPVTSSTTLAINSVNAWSNFAWIEGAIPAVSGDVTIDPAKVKFKYKKDSDSQWIDAAATADGDIYKATLRNLTPSTQYSLKMVYEDATNSFASNERTFTTEDGRPLPNGNLDSWCQGTFNNKSCTYPNALSDYNANTMFWDTSNPGSSLLNKMVTTQETSDVHTAGGSAARLGSQYIVIKFAAASLFTGSFGELKGTSGAAINFGQPWTSRPSQLKGWFKYSGGAINRNGGAPDGVTIKTGTTPDLWSAYCVLATEGYTFDNTDIAGTAWNYETDPRVIAYSALADEKCVNASEWTQFTIDLDYHNLTAKPSTIIIVFSSSKYGDYFTGCDSSVLLLDDLELVYGEPTVN